MQETLTPCCAMACRMTTKIPVDQEDLEKVLAAAEEFAAKHPNGVTREDLDLYAALERVAGQITKNLVDNDLTPVPHRHGDFAPVDELQKLLWLRLLLVPRFQPPFFVAAYVCLRIRGSVRHQ